MFKDSFESFETFSKFNQLALIEEKSDLNEKIEINFSLINKPLSLEDFSKIMYNNIEVMSKLLQISLIPYIYFNVKPEEIYLEKNSLEIILEGSKDLNKFIKDDIVSSDDIEYFMVNKVFWDDWCNLVNWNMEPNEKTHYSFEKEKGSKKNTNSINVWTGLRGSKAALLNEDNRTLRSNLVFNVDYVVFNKR